MPSLVRRLARGALVWRRSGGGDPLQAGALPYRRRDDGTVEVMLVTTRSSGRWIVPKGWPMAGKTLAEAARQEAFEEAGVRGPIGTAELGRFAHQKEHFLAGPIQTEVVVYPLKVEQEFETWPERGQRRRRWFAPADAAVAVGPGSLAGIVAAAAKLD